MSKKQRTSNISFLFSSSRFSVAVEKGRNKAPTSARKYRSKNLDNIDRVASSFFMEALIPYQDGRQGCPPSTHLFEMSIIQPPQSSLLFKYISLCLFKIKSDFFFQRLVVRGRSKSLASPEFCSRVSREKVCIFLNILPHSIFHAFVCIAIALVVQ